MLYLFIILKIGTDELLGVAGDGLRIYRSNSHQEEHQLLAKLLPAQISTSPTSSNAASRRPSDANIITNNPNKNNNNNNNNNTSLLPSRNSPAPITSFDWNRVDSNLLVTSSYDTTCAVWNLDVRNNKQFYKWPFIIFYLFLKTASVKTQLIAHDKEVFDVAFNPKSTDIFASVGAEGSIRLFDTRALDHSTILYETTDAQPLLRLSWNPLDNNYVACFGVDSGQVIIVDVRSAAVPVAILSNHINISAMHWAPHNSGWLTVSDSAGLKLWDVSQNVIQPSWALPSPNGTLQNLVWPSTASDWLAASTATDIHLIKL